MRAMSRLAPLLALAAAPPDARPVQPHGVVKPPRLLAGSISNDDYPSAAIRVEAQGTSHLDLVVAPDGRVTGCAIAQSSGSPVLDHTGCGVVIERFRYAPARDAAGRPAEGRSRFRVVWRLPAEEAPPIPVFAAGEMRVTMVISANAPPRCAVETAGAAFAPIAPFACLMGEPVEAAELARERNAILTVTRFVPEGAAEPEQRPAPGLAMGTAAADLDVAPDGRITGCSRIDLGAAAAPSEMPHPCDAPRGNEPGFAPLQSGTAGRGRLTVTVYRLGIPDI